MSSGSHCDTAVLETMLSEHKILDPTDCSTGHGFDVDVQLRHTLIDTTELNQSRALHASSATLPYVDEMRPFERESLRTRIDAALV